MGRNNDWLSVALLMVVGYFVLFVGVPFLAAVLMRRGFEKFKLSEITFRQCVQACFFASSATIVTMFLLSFGVRSSDNVNVWVFYAGYVLIQMLVVPLLIRKRSGQILLIEWGSIVLACLAGQAVISLLTSGSRQG
jgi:ACR3 family arsenite efflux pump ArsB